MLASLFLLAQVSLPMIEENVVPKDPLDGTNIEQVDYLRTSIVAGGLSSLGSQDSYSISPTAAIETYAKLAESKYAPDLVVKINLSALPEEDFELTDATTFKSLEFEAGLGQRLPSVFPQLYGGFGIATRLPGDTQPRVNAAKYFTVGIRFATSDDSSYLYIGGGPDQRLDPAGRYLGTAHIQGMLKLYSYKDAKLSLKGDAILGGSSSLVRIGVVIGV